MTILLTGGGTGGHITPLLAVAHELKQLKPDVNLIYVGERGGRFQHLTSIHPDLDQSFYISAGKFRRYHGESIFRRILDIKTNLLNIRDGFLVLAGFLQALVLLLRKRPDVIFVKGGFVGVPLGIAAALCRIPYVTHDSDTMPGLANRIVGRWAFKHATGMPTRFYPYPGGKTVYTGIPLVDNYVLVDENLQREYQKTLGIPEGSMVLLITGGSLGAKRLNRLAAVAVTGLIDKYKNLYVFHQTGEGQQDIYDKTDARDDRVKAFAFEKEMFRYSGAADLIIARGGATYIAEFAMQGKAAIIIPHPELTHQLENAAHIAAAGAAIVLFEADLKNKPVLLKQEIERLLADKTERRRLASSLSTLNKTDAARELALLLIEVKR